MYTFLKDTNVYYFSNDIFFKGNVSRCPGTLDKETYTVGITLEIV